MSDRFILIGHPVAHSLSPAIHAAAYAELKREGRYELVDAPDERAVIQQVESLRRGELRGINITVPWKRLALALADRVDESAGAVGAANVLARGSSGEVVAHNTDAPGLAGELEELVMDLGGWGEERGALVLGNGGAALGAVGACRLAGAQRIFVAARSFHLDVPQEKWPQSAELVRLGAELVAWPVPQREAWLSIVRRCQLIVQATSAGMHGADSGEAIAALLPWQELPRLAAYDLVYNPGNTPFLQQAAEGGHVVRGGLGMLVRQAALALQIWWGELPRLEPLEAAAKSALGNIKQGEGRS